MSAPSAAGRVCTTCGSRIVTTASDDLGCLSCLLRTGAEDEPNWTAATPGMPDSFGVYVIQRDEDGAPRELGRGAMGITFLAEDVSLQRPVALKIIKTDLAHGGAEARERFMREARAAAALRHPNVATVYQFGIREESGQCFCAMELIEGETLEDRVRRTGPLGVRSAVEIARQITSALGEAEKRGLVHRDLKPANIMILAPDHDEAKAEGVVKIIDFGVAKALAETPNTRVLTQNGFIGTPAFASPEQFLNAPIDVRSDIFSLGATLWYLLTGRMPFGDRGHPELGNNPPPLEDLKAAHVPSSLSALLLSMLATEPAMRPGVRDLTVMLKKIEGRLAKAEKPLRRFALAAVLIVLAATGAFFSFHYFGIQRSNPATDAPDKSIAVLPLTNLSVEQENAFFADGIQDDIVTALAKVADLKVISRTSVMGYTATAKRDLRAIGQALRVVYVLEGSVRRSGGRVRVTARLIDTRTNTNLWAESYDRDLADVFAIQADIAQQITKALQAKLSPSEQSSIEQPTTTNVAAFELYTHARTSRLTATFGPLFKDRLLQGIAQLDEAVALDPAFLLAWHELAAAHDLLYFAGYDHTPARLGLADHAVQTLLRLRPDAGVAHLALARHLYQGYRDYDNARRELEIARRTLPNSAEVFALTGYIDRRQGRWAESTRNLERAIELDPRNWFTLGQIATNYSQLRRYSEAAAVLDRALAIVPKDVLTRVTRAWVDFEWRADVRPLHVTIAAILAEDPAAASAIAGDWLFLALCERDRVAADEALAALHSDDALTIGAMFLNRAFARGLAARVRGDEAAARAAFTIARAQQEKVVRAQPEYAQALCVLGLIDAGLGRKEEALDEGRRARALLPIERDSLGGADLLTGFAIICAWTGEKDQAFEQLALAVARPGLISYGQLKLQPWWDPLRGDPRFEKIVASLAPAVAEK